MAIQLFALDMDGTLLQPDHCTISAEDQEAIAKAAAKGVHFVPATGRMKQFIPKPVQEMDGWRYAITSNGAAVYDRKADKLIHTDYLTSAVLCQVVDVLLHYPVFFEIYANGASYILKERLVHATAYGVPEEDVAFFRGKGTPIVSVEEFLQQERGLEKLYIPYIDPSIHAALKAELCALDVSVTSSVDTNLEVNSRTANKGTALRVLCAHLGLPIADAMAVGDNTNDLEMLQEAGLGVAMGNADPTARQAADVVTGCNWEHGVAQAIQQYILEEESQ